MQDLSKFLSPIDVSLESLLLDPNNPRFADFGDGNNPVPESRISEERVQSNTYERMKSKRFNVSELRDTIKTVGYLPMDRIVIRHWNGEDTGSKKYVIVEGNRRVTALNWLIELHETGRETFTEDQIKNFTNVPALILDEELPPINFQLILPGLRHVSGIKEWGPYQRARAVHELRQAGYPPREVAQSLGLSTVAANRLWRSYLGLEQMRADEEYGEWADPDLYSYFEEIIKSPRVRNWLSWNDEEEKFTHEERVPEIYSWIIGEPLDDEDEDKRGNPKLPEAKSVRILSKFIEDKEAMDIFRVSGNTLTHALSKYAASHPEAWQGSISDAKTTLASITTDSVRSLSDEDILLLNELIRKIKQVLEDHKLLTKSNE